jgi:hypothetical protein
MIGGDMVLSDGSGYHGIDTKPTNLAIGWVGGKDAFVDYIQIFPLVELMIEDYTVGQTTLKIISSKVAKYKKTCSDN